MIIIFVMTKAFVLFVFFFSETVSFWLNWLYNCVANDGPELFHFMCVSILPAYVHVHPMCAVPMVSRRGRQSFWN